MMKNKLADLLLGLSRWIRAGLADWVLDISLSLRSPYDCLAGTGWAERSDAEV